MFNAQIIQLFDKLEYSPSITQYKHVTGLARGFNAADFVEISITTELPEVLFAYRINAHPVVHGILYTLITEQHSLKTLRSVTADSLLSKAALPISEHYHAMLVQQALHSCLNQIK